jgi:hypothetical protein
LEEALSLIYGIKLVERQRGLFYAVDLVQEKLMVLLSTELHEGIDWGNEFTYK